VNNETNEGEDGNESPNIDSTSLRRSLRLRWLVHRNHQSHRLVNNNNDNNDDDEAYMPDPSLPALLQRDEEDEEEESSEEEPVEYDSDDKDLHR